MEFEKMYKGQVNSPATFLINEIDEIQTEIEVTDPSVLPNAPNIACIGTGLDTETIMYESIEGNTLKDCIRGFQGKAKEWGKLSVVSRIFTEYDLGSVQRNINILDNIKASLDDMPNFKEENETFAEFSNDLKGEAILGSGWTGEIPTFTTVAGSNGVLSFPIDIIKDKTYSITYTRTGTTATENFNIIFANNPNDTEGQEIATNININDRVFIKSLDNYTHLNIVPMSAWAGNFTLTSVLELKAVNSNSISINDIPITVKNNNIIFSTGGSNVIGDNNVGLGTNALKVNNEGKDNTGIGANALQANTTGECNIAVGTSALLRNTAGESNIAIGVNALQANTTTDNNTAIGTNTLTSNTTGVGNTAVGASALMSNTTGGNTENTSNTAVGNKALMTNTTGSSNVAIGTNALQSNTTGAGHVAVGVNALRSRTTAGTLANGNVAIGSDALQASTTSTGNTAIGTRAMFAATTGNNNTAIGLSALSDVNTGASNTAIGANALFRNTTGASNTAIGVSALQSNTAGVSNVAIGVSALLANTTGGNNVIIGASAGATSTHNIINSSVIIGQNAQVNATSQTNQIVIGQGAVGGGNNTITLGNNNIAQLRCRVTTITATSDTRVKEDIEPANTNICYDTVKNLPVTRYKYKDFMGESIDKHVTGFMADHVEKIFPKSVTKLDREFPVLDESGKQVYETKVVKEEVEETYEEIEEIAVKEINPKTKEVKNVIKNVPIKKTRIVEKEVEKEVPKTFIIDNVKEITMTEAVPTLWGALQKVMEKLENQEDRIKALEGKINN